MGNINETTAKKTKLSTAKVKLKDYQEKYQISMDKDHQIGGGAFGSVFRITRKSDGIELAMKVSKTQKNELLSKNAF